MSIDPTSKFQAPDSHYVQSSAAEAPVQAQLDLLEAMPQMLWLADSQGQIIYLNRRWSEYTGLAITELLGQIFNFLHPDDRDRFFEQWQQARQAQQDYDIELRLRSSNGSYHWFTAQARVVKGSHQWLGSLTPISRQEQIEIQLQRQQQFLQALLDNLAEGIVACNAQGELTLFNRAAQEFHGLPQQSILSHQWAECYDLYQADGRTPMSQAEIPLFRALMGESIRDAEMMIIPKQGQPRTILASGAPIISPAGIKLGAVVAMRDITERKQAEAAVRQLNDELEQRVAQRTAELAENERQYRTVVNSVKEIIFQTDTTNCLTFLNPAWREITGFEIAESLNTLSTDYIYAEEDQQRCAQLFQLLMSEEQASYHYEFRLLTKTGDFRWLAIDTQLIRDEAGNILGTSGTMNDITERKQTEAILQARADELARINTILLTTAAQLERRNQELDQFAYVTSHDLKAPLRAIANLSEWIEEDIEGQLTDDTRHQMQLLRGRVHRMEALINGLLEYSRVGRIKAESEPVAVAALLEEIIDSLAPPPSFTVTIEGEMPTFTTRRLSLQQILTNLISNAIKHHDRSDGNITISVRDIGAYYEFRVADDGPGIAPEYREKVFVIFQTLNARDEKENTGIGLSLVKKIVETQGGSIWIKSQPGEGAAFYFTLPK